MTHDWLTIAFIIGLLAALYGFALVTFLLLAPCAHQKVVEEELWWRCAKCGAQLTSSSSFTGAQSSDSESGGSPPESDG